VLRGNRALARNVLLGAALLLLGMLTQAGTASAATFTAPCSLSSVSSFVDQGELGEASSIADVLELQCEKVYAGVRVRFTANPLYFRCQRKLEWSTPTPYTPVSGSGYSVKLDGNGRAVVAVWGGPGCATGESLLSAHMEAPPYTTVTTKFTIEGPMATPEGVFALTPNGKSSEVENSATSSVAVIVAVEFSPVNAEQPVHIAAEQLFSQCHDNLRWVGPDAKELANGVGSVSGVKLDDDGNAFVVLLGGPSCAAAPGEIVTFLENPPLTRHTTTFTVLAPQ